jgi:hypothetical protein
VACIGNFVTMLILITTASSDPRSFKNSSLSAIIPWTILTIVSMILQSCWMLTYASLVTRIGWSALSEGDDDQLDH